MNLREMMALVGVQAQETAAFLGVLTRKEHDVGIWVLSNISGKAEEADSRPTSRNKQHSKMAHLGIVPLSQ